MAEKVINLPVTRKKIESDGSSSGKTSIRIPNSPDNGCGILPHGTSTSRDSCHGFNNSRRNSTGEPILQKSIQKIVPRYLRASTGSCHDFCKYGKKHAFEEKERRPFVKRIVRASSDKQNPAVTLSMGERKKPILHKQIISPDMTVHSSKHGASPGAINLADPPEIIKLEVLLPSKKVEVSPDCDPLSHNKTKAERRMNNFSNKHSPSVWPPPIKKMSPVKQSSDKQNTAVTLSMGLRKKATVLNKLSSPDMTSHSVKHGASPGVINSADPAKIIKQEVLMPTKKVEVSSKYDPKSHKLKAEKRRNNICNSHSPSAQTSPMKQLSFQTLKFAKKVEKAEKMSNLSLKCSPSLGPQPPTKKVEKTEKTMNNLTQKCSPSVGPQRAVSKLSSLICTPQNTNGRVGKDYIQVSKNVMATKASARKVMAAPSASLSFKPSISRNVTLKVKNNRSLKVGSPLNYQNRTQKTGKEKADSENVPEKILHVIVTETGNSISESPEDSNVFPSLAPHSFPSPKSLSQLQSPSLASHEEEVEEGEGEGEEEEGELKDYDSVDDEEEVEDGNASACEATGKLISNKNRMANHNNRKALDGNPRKTLRKGVVYSESKDSTPVKLKFRRGKVVDIQSEINGPWRLRFRQGRVTEEHHDRKNEIKRRNFKKKDSDGDGNDTNPNNEKVVLRHQDQGRKDAQGLFNNVIEETASKLVESRKSKVKALVGAFETVISLQDTKPSPQNVS